MRRKTILDREAKLLQPRDTQGVREALLQLPADRILQAGMGETQTIDVGAHAHKQSPFDVNIDRVVVSQKNGDSSARLNLHRDDPMRSDMMSVFQDSSPEGPGPLHQYRGRRMLRQFVALGQ
jgi:hypothetical protein